MNILAIDSSSKICGVSVKKDKKIISYNKYTGFQHEIILFDKVIECLKKTKLKISDIDLIVVSNGPGSYTGLRIGVSLAIGLSIKSNIPIVYIDTLHQLANNVIGKYDYILPIIDAKANRVYTALFDKNLKRITDDEIIDIDKLINILKKYIGDKKMTFNICLLGDGVDAYKEKLLNFKSKNIIYADKKKRYNDSKSLIDLYKAYKISKIPNVNYMQVSQAERNLKK